MTPNNIIDGMKSSANHSPRSSYATDNYFSFNESLSKHRQSAFFLSREDSDRTFFRIEDKKEGRSTETSTMKIVLEAEKNVLIDFAKLLRDRERIGRLPFAATTGLAREKATSGNSIFRYDSISFQEEWVDNAVISKRVEKEVILDYDVVNRPGGLMAPSKRVKTSNREYNYSNTDLVYSSWYDAVLSKINEESDAEIRKYLLIDLNDKSVFYSKLVALLTEPDQIIEQVPIIPDLALHNMPNSKILEKYINKAKKEVRIKIAKTKGGNELEDKANDEIFNEEDLKIISLVNHPNGQALMGTKGFQFNKIASKKIKKITNYNHSEVADTFQFNIFRMSKDKIKNLHRFDLAQVVYGEILANKNAKWRVRIQNNSDANNPLRKQLNRKSKIIANINSQEIHHSHEIFKKFSKLSLKGDDFFLFEYIEQNPLILGNIGMASRLTKYYYPTKICKKIFEEHGADLEEKEQISLFRHFLKDKFGEHGEENPLKRPNRFLCWAN